MYLLSADEVENWLGDELDFKLSFVGCEATIPRTWYSYSLVS